MAQAKHVGKLIVSICNNEGLPVQHAARVSSIDADASYLITGGLGGSRIGYRRPPCKARRTSLGAVRAQRSVLRRRRRCGIPAAERGGGEDYPADITDREQAKSIIADVERTMGPLRGIMHAAMVLDDAPIERLDEERMWTAMRPKIIGAWNLHTLSTDIPLDFFVLFSSITSIIGNPGQANYVAGNAFLDMLAYYRRGRGLPALTVNWGGIGEVGYVVNSPETTRKARPLRRHTDAFVRNARCAR